MSTQGIDLLWGLLHGHWRLSPEVLQFLEDAGLMHEVKVPPGEGFGSMHELTEAGRSAFTSARDVPCWNLRDADGQGSCLHVPETGFTLIPWEDKKLRELADAIGLIAKLKAENVCDACAGTGKPESGHPCMCSGTGSMAVAARWLREEVVRTRQEIAKLTKERDALLERDRAEWSDKPDEWSEAIYAAFPTKSGSHEEYGMAMRMVRNRHSKGEVLALINWLLVKRRATVEVQTIEWQVKLLVNGHGVCTFDIDRPVQAKDSSHGSGPCLGGEYIEEMARVLRKALAGP